MSFCRTELVLFTVLGIVAAAPDPAAASPADLQGAWAPSAADCSRFFRKKGRTIEFVRKGLGEPTHFIIDGQRARGPRASCQIRSIRARDDVFDVRLGCQTAVIADSFTFSVRFSDKDSLARFDPSYPDVEGRFERCKF